MGPMTQLIDIFIQWLFKSVKRPKNAFVLPFIITELFLSVVCHFSRVLELLSRVFSHLKKSRAKHGQEMS